MAAPRWKHAGVARSTALGFQPVTAAFTGKLEEVAIALNSTLGNHEFDLGPDGLGQAIRQAAKAGDVSTMLVTNTDVSADSPRLTDLQAMAQRGVLQPYRVIERDGQRFGLVGIIGYDAFKGHARNKSKLKSTYFAYLDTRENSLDRRPRLSNHTRN